VLTILQDAVSFIVAVTVIYLAALVGSGRDACGDAGEDFRACRDAYPGTRRGPDMSGRTRWRRPDGELVTGCRKTDRRNALKLSRRLRAIARDVEDIPPPNHRNPNRFTDRKSTIAHRLHGIADEMTARPAVAPAVKRLVARNEAG
jgi:hypothetical protein